MEKKKNISVANIDYWLEASYSDFSRKYFTLTKHSIEDDFCITFCGTLVSEPKPAHYRYTTEYIFVDGNYIEEKKLSSNEKAAIAEALSILNSSYSEM